jgi:hypothetical protein
VNAGRLLSTLGAVATAALVVVSGSSGTSSTCTPTLQITSPVAGSIVRTPFPVRYSVSCFALGHAPAGHVELVLGPVRRLRIPLVPAGEAGVLTVPRYPLLSGRRTLVFELAHADRSLLRNPAARVMVGPLTILGPR